MLITKEERIIIIEHAFSWIAAFGLIIYGISKPVQFGNASEMNRQVADLTGMELMWAFYSYSATFVILIGILEVTSGLLLAFPKYRLAGALLATPVLTNIILQDIFYGVHRGALLAALIYQFSILVIFWIRRNTIADIMKSIMYCRTCTGKTGTKRILILSFVLFVVLRILEFYIISF